MGWKSTIDVSRKHVLYLIRERLEEASDTQLAIALEDLGFGDDLNLPYHGRNFNIIDDEDTEG